MASGTNRSTRLTGGKARCRYWDTSAFLGGINPTSAEQRLTEHGRDLHDVPMALSCRQVPLTEDVCRRYFDIELGPPAMIPLRTVTYLYGTHTSPHRLDDSLPANRWPAEIRGN
jgi:hypothetical protein